MIGGLFWYSNRRNDGYKLSDPHPLIDYGDDVCKGNAGLDGFSVLSRASPTAQGNPPSVAGTLGRAFMGPSQDFEQ